MNRIFWALVILGTAPPFAQANAYRNTLMGAWSYYYPSPAWCSPVPSSYPSTTEPPRLVSPTGGQPPSSQSPVATPTAAPPSSLPLAPLPRQGPGVSESRSFFDAYQVMPRASEQATDSRIRVGFWNVTDRDIALTVAGQRHVLAAGKNIKLNVGRQFDWRVEGREEERETIPGGAKALEIVIRR